MHGRVKSSVQPSREELATRRAQIGKYVAAKDLFLSRRQLRSTDARTSELTAKLIELNPDFYSLWALRKEQLTHNVAAQSEQRTDTTTQAPHRTAPYHTTRSRPVLHVSTCHGQGRTFDRLTYPSAVLSPCCRLRISCSIVLCCVMLCCAVCCRVRPDRSVELCSAELLVAEKGLRRNPKCYSAWHHRLWVLDRGHSDLTLELDLCSSMLDLDARNCNHSRHAHHAYNSRRVT